MLSIDDLAMSTMWNFKKARSGDELLDQLAALGFHRVELNYHVKEEWLPAIERRIGRDFSVSSVHNVFPETDDKRFDTDSVLLGYLDEDLRRKAVEYAKQSMRWAVRLGAGAVVVHPTEVPLPPALFDVPLKALVKEGKTDTEEYKALYQALLDQRKVQPYIDALMKSLDELAEFAARQAPGVYFGMENRAMCHQIPIFGEFERIVERFHGSAIKIWFDTGHAIMMQEIGLQRMPLPDAVRREIIGVHIHDAARALDHYAPCTLDGDVLAPYMEIIRGARIKVLELSGRLSAETITSGTERFIEKYNQGEA